MKQEFLPKLLQAGLAAVGFGLLDQPGRERSDARCDPLGGRLGHELGQDRAALDEREVAGDCRL